MLRVILAIGLSLFLYSCQTFPFTVGTVCKPEVLLNSPYKDQVLAADLLVKEKFSEWYQEGTCITVAPGVDSSYAESTQIKATKEIYITLNQPALSLKNREDLAQILLHEYVHVTGWKTGRHKELSPTCKMAVDELDAYNIDIQARPVLGSSFALQTNSLILYTVMHIYAVEYCPKDAYKDYPLPVDQPLNK